jgi:GT2 family glycosyltransferase
LPNRAGRTRPYDVIVVTYNGQRHIRQCLDSLAQSGTPLSAVMVVDNASTDGTAEIVGEGFPEVRLIRSPTNLGYGGGINLALESSSAEYLVVMNQDLVSGRGWIDRLVEALQMNPAYGLATPMVRLRSNPELVNACGIDIHYTGITTCRGYGRPARDFVEPHRVPAVSGAAFVVRRQLLELLGGMDPLFFMYLEDADLSLRAALLGMGSLCVPEATVIHDFRPTFNSRKIFWLERNRALLLLRLYRRRTLLALAPALALTEFLVLAYSLSRGGRVLGAKLQAYAWIMLARDRIAASRRRIQGDRKVDDGQLLATLTPGLEAGELDGRLPRIAVAFVNPLFRVGYRLTSFLGR